MKKRATGSMGGGAEEHFFALPRGTRLFEFEIESVLGHGGFGITYLARDTFLDEQVAIKEFFPNDLAVRVTDATVRGKSVQDQGELDAGVKAFLAEARLMARFRHRNIVHVRRFFELHGTGYIVQDYEEGQTLGQRLAGAPMGEAELRRLLLGILDGLETVHERAILHRDLKPDNIILRADGTPVLIDFGAAREFAGRHSRSITAIAAGGYTPPEQWGVGGQQGPWSDLYALGAIAYRAVTGAAPPVSLQRLRNDPLVPAAAAAARKYDATLLTLIDWMLKVDEGARPDSVQVIREALAGKAIPTGISEPSASDVAVTAMAPGHVRLTFVPTVTADVLELAFLVTPPGEYLAPSGGAAPTWRKQPHYFSLDRVAGATSAVFDAGPEIADHIPDKARVLMTSADGFLRAQGVWSRPPAASRSRAWAKIAASAVLAIAVGIGLYWAYAANERRAAAERAWMAEQQAVERQRMEQQFTAAGFRRDQLEQLLASCGSTCTEDLKRRIQSRLDTIATEDASYQAAGNDPAKLLAYARTCQACLNRADAEKRVTRIQETERERASLLHECDRLAAHPFDSMRPESVIGVSSNEINHSLAIDACRAAYSLRSNDPRIAFQLGRALQQDGDIDGNREAVRLFRRAAESRSAAAMAHLGYMYDKGLGVAQSDADAVQWYRRAADAGNAVGMNNIATMYRDGRGLVKDEREAALWYKRAADLEMSTAMFNLGVLYEFGIGITKDMQQANHWYQRAAVAGNKSAKDALARIGTQRQATLSSSYTFRTNRDIYGQDIRLSNGQLDTSGSDIEACAARCSNDNDCIAFSFDRWKGKCYLKNGITNSLLLPSSTIAVKKPIELPRVSMKQFEIVNLHNSRFNGQPIERKSASDFQACRSLCSDELRCVAFNFLSNFDNSRNCELFNLTDGYVSEPSADSGYKYQRPF